MQLLGLFCQTDGVARDRVLILSEMATIIWYLSHPFMNLK